MRDVSKPFRLSVFNCLNGNLSGAPVYDEKQKVTGTDTLFVLLSTQQQVPDEDISESWISRASIDIEVIQKTGSEVSKDDIDDVSNDILGLLLPSPWVAGVVTPSGFQFTNAKCESIISRNLSLSETESVVQKIIRFSVQVIQQS